MSEPSAKMPEFIADDRSPGGGRIGGVFISAAMAILILAVASRCFLGELGFRTSPLRSAYALLQMGDAGRKDAPQMLPKELGEFSRVSMAILLMGAFCLGEIGRLLEKKPSLIRRGLFGWLAIAFIAVSALSAWLADDLRSAWDGWLEQASLVMMFLLAADLCQDKRRFALTAVVLAGLGAALAAKGLVQIGIEVPARIAAFEADPAGTLAQLGYRPGTPEARLLESRIRDRTAIGFLPLANLFASMLMIVLAAAAGLAADKLSVGRRQAVEFRMPKGRLSPMSSYGVLAVVVSIIVLAVLLMTRSRSGLVFAGAVCVSAVLAGIFRGFFARHRWKIVAVGLTILIAGSAWLIWYGIKYDRLPAKSLTFRWFYWTASADIVRESGTATVLGVGPGNFPAAYLRHRRAEAEESIKMPHNTLAHAAAEYGLVGGTMFVGLLVLALLGAARKGRVETRLASKPWHPTFEISNLKSQIAAGGGWATPEGWSGGEKFLLLLVAPCAAVARVQLVGWGDSAFLDVILPAVALAGGLWLFGGWALQAVAEGPGFTRMAIGFGALALALHSLMEPNLWTPAPATLFWLAAGMCLGQAHLKQHGLQASRATLTEQTGSNENTACKQAVAPDSRTSDQIDAAPDDEHFSQTGPGFLRLIFCIFVICLTSACNYYIWRPVENKSMLNCKVQSAALADDVDAAIKFAILAANSDPLDGTAAIDAARLALVKTDRRDRQSCETALKASYDILVGSAYFRRLENRYQNYRWKKELTEKLNSWFHIQKNSDGDCGYYDDRALFQFLSDLEWNIRHPDYFMYPWDLNIAPSENAANAVEDSLKKRPLDPQLNWTLGQIEYARGNYLTAYSLFKKVSELDPAADIVRYRMGDAAWNAGRKDMALQDWQPLFNLTRGDGLVALAIAEDCDPMDSRLQMEYPRKILDAWGGRPKLLSYCLDALSTTREIQAKIKSFNPESLELFSPAEWRELETLEARAKFLLEYVKSAPASQSVPQSAPAGQANSPQTQPSPAR